MVVPMLLMGARASIPIGSKSMIITGEYKECVSHKTLCPRTANNTIKLGSWVQKSYSFL